jgi:hypothetical protein
MKLLHRIRCAAASLTAACTVLLALGVAAPAAFAINVPPPGQDQLPALTPVVRTRIVVTGGMPGWQITLIAVGAALLAAAAAVLLYRALIQRRQPAPKAA